MRKVCVVVGSRANYSSIKAAMAAIQRHPDLALQTVVGASALLDRYGQVAHLVQQDGFVPDAKIGVVILTNFERSVDGPAIELLQKLVAE